MKKIIHSKFISNMKNIEKKLNKWCANSFRIDSKKMIYHSQFLMRKNQQVLTKRNMWRNFLYNTNSILIKIPKKHETRYIVWLYHERRKCLIFEHINWTIFIYQSFKKKFRSSFHVIPQFVFHVMLLFNFIRIFIFSTIE